MMTDLEYEVSSTTFEPVDERRTNQTTSLIREENLESVYCKNPSGQRDVRSQKPHDYVILCSIIERGLAQQWTVEDW